MIREINYIERKMQGIDENAYELDEQLSSIHAEKKYDAEKHKSLENIIYCLKDESAMLSNILASLEKGENKERNMIKIEELEVGTKVVIREDLIDNLEDDDGTFYGDCLWVDDMEKGEVVVSRVSEVYTQFFVGAYNYSLEMIDESKTRELWEKEKRLKDNTIINHTSESLFHLILEKFKQEHRELYLNGRAEGLNNRKIVKKHYVLFAKIVENNFLEELENVEWVADAEENIDMFCMLRGVKSGESKTTVKKNDYIATININGKSTDILFSSTAELTRIYSLLKEEEFQLINNSIYRTNDIISITKK